MNQIEINKRNLYLFSSKSLIELGMFFSLLVVHLLSTKILSNIFLIFMSFISILMFIAILFNGKMPKISTSTIYLFILVIVFLLSTLTSTDRRASLQYTVYFIIFLFISYSSKTSFSWMDNFLKYSFVFSFIHAAITILSAIFPIIYTSIVLPIYPIDQQNNILYWMNNNAYPGIAGQIGTNAFLITIGVSIMYVKFLSKRDIKNASLLLIFIIALFLTGKRGLLFGNIITFLVIYYHSSLKSKTNKIFMLLGLSISIAFMVYIFSLIIPSLASSLSRFIINLDGADFSSGRLELFIEAIQVFKHFFISGTGINAYFTLDFGSIDTSMGVHNDYIQFLAELGIFGVAFFLIPIISVYVFTIKKIKVLKRTVQYNKYYFFLMFSFYFQTVFLIYALTANPFHYFNSLLYYFLVISIPLYFEGGILNESRNIHFS